MLECIIWSVTATSPGHIWYLFHLVQLLIEANLSFLVNFTIRLFILFFCANHVPLVLYSAFVLIMLTIHLILIFQTIELVDDFNSARNIYHSCTFSNVSLHYFPKLIISFIFHLYLFFFAGCLIVSRMNLTVEGIVWQSKELFGRTLFSQNSFFMEDLPWKMDLFIYFIRLEKNVFTFIVLS